MTEKILRGGNFTLDPRLDRLVAFDERSRDYPVTALPALASGQPRSYTWGGGKVTDQGKEGACVGHGWTGELTARPRPVQIADPDGYAHSLYRTAQKRDQWAGEDYDGTSVLAAAQELQDRGLISKFTWAFSLEALILAVGLQGPAVLGVAWYSGMYDAPGGKVTVSGTKVGGHCILVRGVSLKRSTFLWRNSWGPTYGKGGDAEISFADMGRLLSERGEACIPVRTAVKTAV